MYSLMATCLASIRNEKLFDCHEIIIGDNPFFIACADNFFQLFDLFRIEQEDVLSDYLH